MRRRTAGWASVTWVAALLLAGLVGVVSAAPTKLREESRDGVSYVHVNDVLRSVNGSKRIDPMLRTLTLYVEGVTFRLLDGSPWIATDNRTWALEAPVQRGGDGWWVPASFVTRVMAANIGSSLRLTDGHLYVNTTPGRLAEVSVRDVSDGVEITLTGLFPAPPRLRVDEREVDVLLPTCEAGALSLPEADGEYVERYTVSMVGGTAVLNLRLGQRSLGYSWRDRGSDRIRLLIGNASDLVSFDPRPARKRGGVRRVVLDPAHGGRDFGAWLPGGLREKWVTLELARLVGEGLREAGFEVYLTRDEDRALTPEARTSMANETKADLYVSFDLETSPGANGADVTCAVHAAVDGGDRTAAVGGHRLVPWTDVQRTHRNDSDAFAKWLLRAMADGSGSSQREPLHLPMRALMGVDMPAVQVFVSRNVVDVEIWRQWRYAFAESFVEAVRDFGRWRWR